MVRWEGVGIALVELVCSLGFHLSIHVGERGLSWLLRMIKGGS